MSARTTPLPVIGISTYAQDAKWGDWDSPAALLPLAYSHQIASAGGIPVLLPPLPGVAGVVARLDGLVLSGGGDIDPAAYGAQVHPRTAGVRQARDEAEFALLAAAVSQGIPVLGICRGLQILNVAFGGTLHQHLPELPGAHAHPPPLPGSFGSHPVRVAPSSLLGEILGAPPSPVQVPTAHHQGIDRLGRGLAATAWAADGLIEGIELARGTDSDGAGGARAHPFTVAVQWHPEAGADPRLFHALIAAAREGPAGQGTRSRAGAAEPLDSPA